MRVIINRIGGEVSFRCDGTKIRPGFDFNNLDNFLRVLVGCQVHFNVFGSFEGFFQV
ncbi:hypothetical protein CAEBREN_05067 [Caenorhabditis brenneri]|uniref:Uncharacterized protein n=1 Tax=Caenorhabditis brenneri TaxID=135651 RepID=G0M828_CAEBE|nr:hypothetical protein CAEBREN_05067 [Caenorhabditis brenneri]